MPDHRRRIGRGGFYPPSRLSARIARRLIEEHGIALMLDPESYSIHVCRETVGHNTAAGMDYNQWTLREYDWNPHPFHRLAHVIMNGREIEVEIGGSVPATILGKRKTWTVDYHRSHCVIRIEPGGMEPIRG